MVIEMQIYKAIWIMFIFKSYNKRILNILIVKK